MNILITSAGRKALLIQYFQQAFAGFGRVIAANSDPLAAALYFADNAFIVPLAKDKHWLEAILRICRDENIGAILPLLEHDVDMVSRHKPDFLSLGVTPIVSDLSAVELCSDKYAMYEFMRRHDYLCAKTYLTVQELQQDLKDGRVDFPMFIKLRRGYGGRIQRKIFDEAELFHFLKQNHAEEFIIQEFIDDQDYNIDCYVDLISKKVISIFIREDIFGRAGLVEKSVSRIDEKLLALIETFVLHLGLTGPLNVQVFKVNGEYSFIEVNPRFAAGYLHAHGCGENFPVYIRNNLQGIANERHIGNYTENVYMFTYESVVIKKAQDMKD